MGPQSGESLAATHVQPDFVVQLIKSGFAILPGVISAKHLADISAAYDHLMNAGSGSDFRIGSTTARLYFVDSRTAFEDVYQCTPLMEACTHLLGETFRLSSLLGRTLRAGTPAQDLHADIGRDCVNSPMVGFILMLDPFQRDNGATRFIPGSQNWPDLPSDRFVDPRLECEGEILACGDAGSMIIFNAAVWHGHTANATSKARRSIQGYFIRCGTDQEVSFSA